jgi:hypothetical protein
MVNFWPSFPALFFNHTINPALFETRLKTTVAGNTPGGFAIALWDYPRPPQDYVLPAWIPGLLPYNGMPFLSMYCPSLPGI